MHLPGGDKSIGNQGVLTVDVAMIQIEKALRVTLAVHVAALGIGRAGLELAAPGRFGASFNGGLLCPWRSSLTAR